MIQFVTWTLLFTVSQPLAAERIRHRLTTWLIVYKWTSARSCLLRQLPTQSVITGLATSRCLLPGALLHQRVIVATSIIGNHLPARFFDHRHLPLDVVGTLFNLSSCERVLLCVCPLLSYCCRGLWCCCCCVERCFASRFISSLLYSSSLSVP